MMHSTLVLSSIIGAVAAKEWTITPGTSATTLVGVGAKSDTLDVAAACQSGTGNNAGAFVERFDGKTWVKEPVEGGMMMDSAVSSGVTVAVSMFPVVISTDGGQTYTVQEEVAGLSQSASVFGDGNDIGLVGSFTNSNKDPAKHGVAYSSDAGATWTLSGINDFGTRYGAFPSKSTWFVTSGSWPAYYSSIDENSHHDLSSRISISKRTSSFHVNLDSLGRMSQTNSSGVQSEDGWWGTISKTTDSGATWETVFQSSPTDTYYFNAIDCSSDTHCVAVTEGDSVSDSKAFVTFDGGETWTNALEGVVPEDSVSLMGASWSNDLEGWLAGTAKNGRVLTGLFYKTVDGGKTFAVEQELDDCFAIDLDMAGDFGVAACSNSAGSSSSVATYA